MNQLSELQARIRVKLCEIAQRWQMIPECELARLLSLLNDEVEKLEQAESGHHSLRVHYEHVLECCILSRKFTDWLQTLFLLTGYARLHRWQELFKNHVERVRRVAMKTAQGFDDAGVPDLAGNLRHYAESMAKRQTLAAAIVEGHEDAESLLAELKDLPEAFVTAGCANLPCLKPETFNGSDVFALFFFWRSVRVLRHKLLLSAVEFKREAGPWLKSVADHSQINEHTVNFCEALLQTYESEPCLRLSPHHQELRRVFDEVRLQVTTKLRELLRWSEIRPLSIHEDRAKEGIQKLAAAAYSLHADLKAIETAVAAAWETHEDDLQNVWENLTISEGKLPELLQKLQSGGVEKIEEDLADWLDAILLHGWSTVGTGSPEATSLWTYRKFMAFQPGQAAEYIIRCLSLNTAPGVMHEDVVLMFCGVVSCRASVPQDHGLPPWHSWSLKALNVGRGRLGGDFTPAGRVALCAAFTSISIRLADRAAVAALQLLKELSDVQETLEKSLLTTDDRAATFFLPHVIEDLRGHTWSSEQAILSWLKQAVTRQISLRTMLFSIQAETAGGGKKPDLAPSAH